MTIKEIKEYFGQQTRDAIPEAIEAFKEDTRQGVQKICRQYGRIYDQYQEDLERVQLMGDFDQVFQTTAGDLVAGIDEAGRGPLAGPVVAAAVILPRDIMIEGINDSKKLTQAQREGLYDVIIEKAISVGVGIVSADIIDEINILQATFRAMKKAVFSMDQSADILLVDGNQTIPDINQGLSQHAIIQGDAKSMCIAAASIIAKVTRDRIMVKYDAQYKEFLFASNKGYGSLEHQAALREFGPSPIHRMSFLGNILR